MERIETRQLSEQVYQMLRHQIITHQLAAGDQIVDTKLARELGVSRTPVKHALNKLAAEGLVKIIPRKGSFVTRIDARILDEVFDIRSILEAYAIQRGADLITEEELRSMHEVLEKCEPLVRGTRSFSAEGYNAIDAEFHRMIVHSSRNQTLIAVYENLGVFVSIARMRYRRGIEERLKAHNEHKVILEAMENRDKAKAIDVLLAHIERAKREYLESLVLEASSVQIGQSSEAVPSLDPKLGFSSSPVVWPRDSRQHGETGHVSRPGS